MPSLERAAATGVTVLTVLVLVNSKPVNLCIQTRVLTRHYIICSQYIK